MLIDLNTMEEKCIPNFKGGEIAYNVKMFTDDTNKIMKGRLVPGASIGYHTHEEDEEIIFILSGHIHADNGAITNRRFHAKFVRHRKLWFVQTLVYPEDCELAMRRLIQEIDNWEIW